MIRGAHAEREKEREDRWKREREMLEHSHISLPTYERAKRTNGNVDFVWIHVGQKERRERERKRREERREEEKRDLSPAKFDRSCQTGI